MKKWILIIVIIAVGYFVFTKKYYPNEKACKLYSENTIGNSEYKKVYSNILDSIAAWDRNNLYGWNDQKWGIDSKVDSLLCFNVAKDKFIGVILYSGYSSKQDDIVWFYGVKIKNKWYYFTGPDMVIIRSHYQEDSNRPLPFSKLHELAVEHIFRGYLYQSLYDKIFRPNHWNINEEFFGDLTSVAWGHCQTQECWNERYLEIVKENGSKIDPR
jgi:hypothetical protein